MSAGPKVTIVGGGTMGLAAAWALARRGARVELFERHGHVHEHGSHGGHTRVIRHAYHEGADYVRLVSHADREWVGLGERAGDELLVRCGLLEFGSPDDEAFAAAYASLREHGIRHQPLDVATARARYGFVVPEGWSVCLSPDSGYLRVRPCLDALRAEAEAHGARLRYGARVRELSHGGDRVRVLLDDGTLVASDVVVVAAGAWADQLLPGRLELRVLRRVLAWTEPTPERRAALRDLPVWGAFTAEGFFYGFPHNDEGVSGFKLACHAPRQAALAYMDEPVDPDAVSREIEPRDLEPLRSFIARYRPDAGPIVTAKTCLYASSPSEDFYLDHHPDDARVVVAAGFSGHGFKFTPAIGQAIAGLVLDGDSELVLPQFRLRQRT